MRQLKTQAAKEPTKRATVAEVAEKIIRANPSGIRWAPLYYAVVDALPDLNKKTIVGSLHNFRHKLPPDIVRPERGLYAVAGSEGVADEAEAETVVAATGKYKEQDFYQGFADWLVGELEEATVAKVVGGNLAGGKWGTPDVVGLFQCKKTDPIQFTEEVIAAEIKINTQTLIEAFGQACAYKLFSHRVYIVVPRTANTKDLKRLDALAGVVGIGLVIFNPADPAKPEFQVMVRAAKHEPDYYYTNETLKKFGEQFDW